MKSKVDKDILGSRMKKYELVTQLSLPPRTYTILRVDGRTFHTWTKKLIRPYDTDLINCIDTAAIALCEQISGTLFAFAQSDEISLLAVDFLDIKSQSWFDGNVQKWVSVGASITTMAFNNAVAYHTQMMILGDASTETKPISKKSPNATFDARVYSIPDFIEVENYFVYRQKDAIRNSTTMLAQAYASHKQLQGKSTADRHEIIHAAGDNWAKHPVSFKHGRVIRKSGIGEWGRDVGDQPRPESYAVGNWHVDHETPVFTKNRQYLRNLIPLAWENDSIVRKVPE